MSQGVPHNVIRPQMKGIDAATSAPQSSCPSSGAKNRQQRGLPFTLYCQPQTCLDIDCILPRSTQALESFHILSYYYFHVGHTAHGRVGDGRDSADFLRSGRCFWLVKGGLAHTGDPIQGFQILDWHVEFWDQNSTCLDLSR
eukprot:6203914-Pleurochrysis_carterae.AAC.2